MEDVAPELLRKIRDAFSRSIKDDPEILAVYQKIKAGVATYSDAEEYAYLVGEALSQAFGRYISRDELPDGKMYFNIADRVIRPLLEEDHSIISDAALMVQESLNQKAGIGIRPQIAPVNEDRINGIVNMVSRAEEFDDVAWVLDEPIKNFSINVADKILSVNVDFQGRAGLRPRIIRRAERGACPWCRSLAGEYDYPDLPHDVYRRHENCRCVVDYDPGSGRRQNVHTKRWTEPGERDKIEERKRFALDNLDTFRPKDHAESVRNHVKIDRDALVADAKAGKRHRHGGVYSDAVKKSKKQLQRSIISRTAQVERHAEKIAHPERYVSDWGEKDPRYQAGLLSKWKKDMRRNAEQAEIELSVFDERYGK